MANILNNRRIVLMNATSALAIAAERPPFLRGVYFFGEDFYDPAGYTAGANQWPVADAVSYYVGDKKMSTVRLGTRWEYLQPTLGGPFDETFASGIDTQINRVTGPGGWIVLDLAHNYGRRWVSGVEQKIAESGGVVTQAHIVDFWSRAGARYANRPHVIFNLMNEPYGLTPSIYVAWTNACIAAIRATGARNHIHVNGLEWNFRYWGAGSSNRTYMSQIVDPLNNFSFDVHVYMDSSSQGQSPEITGDWLTVLQDLTTYARGAGFKLFCGEYSFFMDPASITAGAQMLAHFEGNKDVWTGHAFLGGGSWVNGQDYLFRLDPVAQQFTWPAPLYDMPQMQTVQNYLTGASAFNGDGVPTAFSFTDVTGASASTTYESNEITVAGINQRTYISISGGQYSINSAAYRSDIWSVKNGDKVKVKITSGAESTVTNSILTIGGVSDIYSVTTVASPYGPEATTLFSAMTVQPNNTRKTAIDTLISSLKSAGIWTKLDVFYAMAAHDAQAGRLNWKSPANFALTAINSPNFTTDSGYAGNGTSSYLNTGFIPSSNGVAITGASAHIMIWTATALSGSGTYDIGSVRTGTGEYLTILGNGGGNFKQGWLNSGISDSLFTPTTTIGMQLLSGHNGGQVYYANGSSVATAAYAMSVVPDSPIYIGAINYSPASPGGFSPRRERFASLGAELNSTEATAYYNAINTFIASL